MTGLYLHIPFCKKKCNYCDFTSFAATLSEHKDYVTTLSKEMRPFKADTLYIGGGTPSILSAELLEALFKNIEINFGDIKNFKESTFEANPESLSEEKIALLKKYGFTRVSLGLQSACDKHLQTLGRAHDYKTFLSAYSALKDFNVNVDLIAGVPGQTLADFESDIKTVSALKPAHLSVYGLQIEEGTEFFKRGLTQNPPLERAMLEHARDALTDAGYHHYEISNFARPGFESLHNINYWNNGEYLGLGLSAASYLNGVRSHGEFSEKLEGKAHLGETIMLGLRKLDGIVYTEEIKQNFGSDIDELTALGLLEQKKDKIKLTREGLFMANEVFRHFVEPF